MSITENMNPRQIARLHNLRVICERRYGMGPRDFAPRVQIEAELFAWMRTGEVIAPTPGDMIEGARGVLFHGWNVEVE